MEKTLPRPDPYPLPPYYRSPLWPGRPGLPPPPLQTIYNSHAEMYTQVAGRHWAACLGWQLNQLTSLTSAWGYTVAVCASVALWRHCGVCQ